MITKSQMAYNMLYTDIAKNIIKPGEFIDEQKLSAKYNIGRTPIREAVKRLDYENILEIRPRKGIWVKPITKELIDDILETRIHVEPFIAKLASLRREDQEVDALWNLYAKLEKSIEEEDLWEISLIDSDIHKLIAKASKNKVLYGVVDRITANMLRLWIYTSTLTPDIDRKKDMFFQWGVIISCIEKKDELGAFEAMNQHITYGQDSI